MILKVKLRFLRIWNVTSKNVKSQVFLDFQKKRKNVFSNYEGKNNDEHR